MENKETGVFETLFKINVNDKTDKKNKLSYLSWTFAWSEVKKLYPSATYSIWKDEKGNPFTFSDTLGYMCYTTVCINGETLEMWLPVMNGANKAMKNEPYTYKTKYDEKTVESATMFDINKTIMRCLVKNLAMFGLGLYIYSGEDLPEMEPEVILKKITNDQLQRMLSQDIEKIKQDMLLFKYTEEQQKLVDLKLAIK